MGGRGSRRAASGAGGSGLLHRIAGIGPRRRASCNDCGRIVTSRREPRPPGNTRHQLPDRLSAGPATPLDGRTSQSTAPIGKTGIRPHAGGPVRPITLVDGRLWSTASDSSRPADREPPGIDSRLSVPNGLHLLGRPAVVRFGSYVESDLSCSQQLTARRLRRFCLLRGFHRPDGRGGEFHVFPLQIESLAHRPHDKRRLGYGAPVEAVVVSQV